MKKYLPERRLKDRCFSVYLVVMCIKQYTVRITNTNDKEEK
nr:MAG TPA: hypothetical protein [Caudoviricetes sp.]